MQAVIDRPPLAPDLDGGGGERWVQLFRTRGSIEAHLLSGRLNSCGVETNLVKTGPGEVWLHNGADPFAPVDVLVRKTQLEDARLVLAEISYEQPFERAAARTTDWKTVALWWGTALALGLAFTGIALARAQEEIDRCVSNACTSSDARR